MHAQVSWCCNSVVEGQNYPLSATRQHCTTNNGICATPYSLVAIKHDPLNVM